MKAFQRLVAVAVLLALGGALTTARAELDATGQQEVAALLAYVGGSHCAFIRNGKAYGAADARSHLQYKLKYLLQEHKVSSAEDFIALAATESSMSGKPYLVNCDGVEQPSADWLQDELRRL